MQISRGKSCLPMLICFFDFSDMALTVQTFQVDLAHLTSNYEEAATISALCSSLTEKLYKQSIQPDIETSIGHTRDWENLQDGLSKILLEQSTITGHVEACRAILRNFASLSWSEQPPEPEVELTELDLGTSSAFQAVDKDGTECRDTSSASETEKPQFVKCPHCLLPFGSLVGHEELCIAKDANADALLTCPDCKMTIASSKLSAHQNFCRQKGSQERKVYVRKTSMVNKVSCRICKRVLPAETMEEHSQGCGKAIPTSDFPTQDENSGYFPDGWTDKADSVVCENCGLRMNRSRVSKHKKSARCKHLQSCAEEGGVYKLFPTFADAKAYFYDNDMDKSLSSFSVEADQKALFGCHHSLRAHKKSELT